MIHYTTKNTSFLKLHLILKEMGIKNNAFFLQLNNEMLLNVDPRDEEHLTPAQKMMVNFEIRDNVWYYIREVVRIPTSGTELPFIANKLSIAIIWALHNNINIIVQGPRQSGKTTAPAVYYGWAFYWGTSNTEFALYGMSDEQLCGNMARIKDIRSALPKYLQLVNKRDTDNARTMRLNREDGMFNSIIIKATGKSEEAARNVGRGRSTPCQWYDEFAFIEHVQAQYETAVYAYATAAKTAESKGSMHHICLTTTAGFLDTNHGAWAYSMINKAAPFDEKLYDMIKEDDDGKIITNKPEVYAYILNNSSSSGSILSAFMSIKYMYYDLSVDENYLQDMASMVTNPDSFRREVLIEWRSTSADHPIGQDRVAALQKTEKKPADVIVLDNLYFLNLYRKQDDIDFDFPYVCAMDVGSNLGNDFSAIVITDPRDFEVVATLRANHHSIPRFVTVTQYILSRIFTNAIFIVERNGVGSPIAQMMESFLPPSRFYHDEHDKPGIALTKQLRDLMFNEILKTSVMEDMDKIHDRHIISEIVTLRYKNGRIDHDDGKHDDTLIAYLYTKWFLTLCPRKTNYLDPVLIGCNRSRTLSKEQMNNLISKSMNSIKENIFGFATGNTGPTFKPMESANSKRIKQNQYIKTMFELDSIKEKNVTVDKYMDDLYNTSESQKVDLFKEINPYNITEEIKEEYVNASNEDKIDTEELHKSLSENEEKNKEKKALFEKGFTFKF